MPNQIIRKKVVSCTASAGDGSAKFTGGPFLFRTQVAGEFGVTAGNDMAVDFWVEFDTLPAGGIYLLGTSGGFPDDGWWVDRDSTSGLITFHYYNGATYQSLGTVAPTTGVWYHVRFSYEHATPVLGAVVQDTSSVLFSGTVGSIGTMHTSTLPLRLGWDNNGGVALVGRMDSVCIMGRLLDGGDINLYNGGLGRRFADLAGNAILTGMTAWYDLDEKTGSSLWRATDVNGYTLTATNGAVLSARKRGLF